MKTNIVAYVDINRLITELQSCINAHSKEYIFADTISWRWEIHDSWKVQGANLDCSITCSCYRSRPVKQWYQSYLYLQGGSHVILSLQNNKGIFMLLLWSLIEPSCWRKSWMYKCVWKLAAPSTRPAGQWTALRVSRAVSGVENRNRVWGEPTPGVPINQGPSAPYIHQTNRDWMIQIPRG